MSSDDSRVTPPGEAQPRSSRARSEESPSGADAFVLPEFDSLPDLAPLPGLAPLPDLATLPDLDEFLKADPLAGFDEAVSAQADTVSSSGADAFPNETPATKASPTPSKATPASATTASSRAVPDDIPPRGDSPAPASKETGDTSKSSKRSVAATLAALGATIGTAFSTGHVGGSTTPHVHTPRVPHGSLPSAPLTHAPLPSLPSLPMPTPSLPSLSSLKPAGYQGSAQDTHALSPAWASGATTAWTIPVSAKSADATPQFHVDGSTLYIASDAANSSKNGSAVTVSAYDLSGSTPAHLWTSTGPTQSSAILSFHTPAFVSGEDQVFFHDVVIDKATGAQTQAPWGTDFPLALAGDVMVTCSTTTTCSGWTREGGEWTNLWTTSTATQSGYGLRDHDLGYAPAGTAVAGSGVHASVLVPTAANELPQILNVHTGEAATLSNPDGNADSRKVEVATDGFVVYENSGSRGSVFDSDGVLQATFTAEQDLPALSRDGRQPTTSDIQTFMTHKRAAWATGTVSMTGTGECTITVALTADDSTREVPLPDAARRFVRDGCSFTPKDLRVSADGSTLYVRSFSSQDTNSYIINTADGSSSSTKDFTRATRLTWVFDDMLIGITDKEIKAFVPASS